jgi:hypothetical protein
MILVEPIKIKALLIHPQRYGRSRSGILRREREKNEASFIIHVFFRRRDGNFHKKLFSFRFYGKWKCYFDFFLPSLLNYDFVGERSLKRKMETNEKMKGLQVDGKLSEQLFISTLSIFPAGPLNKFLWIFKPGEIAKH